MVNHLAHQVLMKASISFNNSVSNPTRVDVKTEMSCYQILLEQIKDPNKIQSLCKSGRMFTPESAELSHLSFPDM